MKILNNEKQFAKAIELFEKHNTQNKETWSSLIITQALKACTHLKDVERGLHIHQTISSRFEKDPYILTSLIHFYMQCGNVQKAEFLFEKSDKTHLPIYGAMMKGYQKNNLLNKAIDIFNQIKSPSQVNLTVFFNACASLGTTEALKSVKKTLKTMSKSYYSNPQLVTSLLDALMKCGDVEHAQALFEQSKDKVLPMFGAMMKGYVQNHQPKRAIELFNHVQKPDEIILIILFNACASLRSKEALDLVKSVSQKIPRGCFSNPQLVTSLLDALMKCGDIEHAENIFSQSQFKVQSMYGAMMKGYVENHQPKRAIELFNHVQKPDEIILIILFNACASLRSKEALDLVKSVSQKMPRGCFSNPQLVTSLLDALMKCGDIEHAENIFSQSQFKVQSMYGAMMKGYAENHQPKRAIELFNQVEKPDEIILTILFNACAALRSKEALDLVKSVSQKIPRDCFSNPQLVTSLLDSLMKCGDIEHAEVLFSRSIAKTISMYGAMMKGYCDNNKEENAIELFHEIKKPNDVILIVLFNACAALKTKEALELVQKISKEMPKVYYSNTQLLSSLLDSLMKCGDIEYAQALFDRSKMKTVSMYGAMMNGFNIANDPLKTLNLFRQMKDEVIEANVVIYLCVIKALSKVGDYSICESIIKEIPISLLNNSLVQRTLIDMWGKVGCVEKAKEIFDKTPDKVSIDYAAMVNSYGINGMGIEAVRLYDCIPSNLLTEAAHVCVLNACSHSGLVTEARSIFQKIESKTGNIYSTMVDCLSRASFFTEAQSLIDEYERCHSPIATMYMAVLSGARNTNDVDLSEKIYQRMKTLFPNMRDSLVSGAILLSNVYSSTGELEKSSKIKFDLRKSKLQKKVGRSWTTINGNTYEFRAHDQSHSRSKEIYEENERISKELIEYGHQYDASWITRPLNQDETVESVLCGHSERLAIAWNFVVNPKATKIQITKNLRVCGECHRSTKLIALIRQCEIVVRDANRIHHFYQNGKCSCNDYF